MTPKSKQSAKLDLLLPLAKMFGFLKSMFFGTATTPESLQAAEKLVESALGASRIVVYSKSYCPYCSRAKQLLESLGQKANMKVFELDHIELGGAIQEYLAKRVGAGRVTVPQIYINSKLIGGNSELQALNSSGKLAALLA